MCSVPWGLCWVLWGISWYTWRDIMMHVEGYHDSRRGILWALWGEKSSLSSLQWTPRAPYGVSYMYGTDHLNNYHHNSKSSSIMWDFVRDPFKRCCCAASSLSSLQQTSQVSSGTHLYKCFRAASTLLSLQQTLWASCGALWDPRGQVFGVASTLASLGQTLGYRGVPTLVHVITNRQLPQPI